MKLDKIIKELNIEAEFIGEDFSFETLGLNVAQVDQRLCSFIESEKYISNISDSVSLIITSKEGAGFLKGYPLCIVDSPKSVFFSIHNYLADKEEYVGRKEKTKIGKNCKIHQLSCIADKNVIIGNNVIIEEFVSIKENVIIGDHSVIRSGTVIGSEGFEFKRSEDDYFFVKHCGQVIIGENVEIQHNSCVDKAIYPWDKTVLGDYVKVDNLVHIAHGVKIEKYTTLVANVAIGGRTIIKEGSWIGLSASLRNGITVGKKARVNMGGIVSKDVEDGQSVTGNFAVDHKMFIENLKKMK